MPPARAGYRTRQRVVLAVPEQYGHVPTIAHPSTHHASDCASMCTSTRIACNNESTTARHLAVLAARAQALEQTDPARPYKRCTRIDHKITDDTRSSSPRTRTRSSWFQKGPASTSSASKAGYLVATGVDPLARTP